MRKTWEKRNFTVRDIVVKELSLMRKLLELFFIIWRQGQEIKERLWLALSFFFFIFLTCKFVDVREQEPLSVTTALVLRSFPFSIIITKPRGSEFQLLRILTSTWYRQLFSFDHSSRCVMVSPHDFNLLSPLD